MSDKFIDLDETQIYGPYASKMIRERVIGLVQEFDTGLERLAKDIDHATTAVHEAIETSRDASSNIRSTTKDKGTALQRALSLLGRFSKHLDTQEKGEVDRKRFFPETGTAGGIGKSAPRIAIALGRISSLLTNPESPVKSKDEWLKEFKTALKSLSPLLEHSNNAKTERATATPELEAARQAWMQVYGASKCGVECVLRMTGNMHMMPIVFHDLAVPANGKVTSIPDPPPQAKEDKPSTAG
jgi:hypothetical protein